MIQRYDVDYCTQHACTCEVVKDNEGGYVEYEDYESLLKLNESLTKEIEQYRECIKAAELVVKNFSDIIEQSKKSVAQKDEAWTVWFGGDNPVPGKMVEFKMRNGERGNDQVHSSVLHWDHLGEAWDVVAYRVVKEG